MIIMNFMTRIDNEIKHAIAHIVKDSLVADGHYQHFTRRFQQLTLAKVKKPLERKIQERIG